MWNKLDERHKKFFIDLKYRGDLDFAYTHLYLEGIQKNDTELILKGYEEHKKMKKILKTRSTLRENYLK